MPDLPQPTLAVRLLQNRLRTNILAAPVTFTRLNDKQTYSTGMGDHTHRGTRPGADDHLKYKSRGM